MYVKSLACTIFSAPVLLPTPSSAVVSCELLICCVYVYKNTPPHLQHQANLTFTVHPVLLFE